MSPEERRRRATLLCVELTTAVNQLAPTGIGGLSELTDIVGDADGAFMRALFEWERTGDGDLDRVRSAYDGVLDAWREATRQFERETA